MCNSPVNLPGIHGSFCESYTVMTRAIYILTCTSPNLLCFSPRRGWKQIIGAILLYVIKNISMYIMHLLVELLCSNKMSEYLTE